MSIAAGDQTITQSGTVTINSKIVGSESVAVPTGKFTALKVAQTINLDMVMTMKGLEADENHCEDNDVVHPRCRRGQIHER